MSTALMMIRTDLEASGCRRKSLVERFSGAMEEGARQRKNGDELTWLMLPGEIRGPLVFGVVDAFLNQRIWR